MTTLRQLEQHDEFQQRHIGPSQAEQADMLAAIGVDALATLIDQTVPAAIRRERPLSVGAPKAEAEALAELRGLAQQNQVVKSLIGMGYYNTITPGVIQRNVLENPGWYTAYTPYQPEISQGRLEGLLNFQQLVMDLTGLELANASLLDEATAAAEAMAMCKRLASKNKSDVFFVADDCHPQTIAVVKTRAEHFGFEIVVGPAEQAAAQPCFGALLQYPASTGELRDLRPIADVLHAQNALLVVASDLLAMALLTPPGEMGADVVVGSAQRFGVPMGFGGPHAAFFATRDAFKRSTPGRIIGVSIDKRGNQALRMALQTREQHIRREKANSNICTSQALLAIMAAFYAMYHGPEGIRTIATRVQRLTAILAEGLRRLGLAPNGEHFDTLTLAVADQSAALAAALAAGYNLRPVGSDRLGISLDESSSAADVEALWRVFGDNGGLSVQALDDTLPAQAGVPAALRRQSTYLSHPSFSRYHSETEMLRYLKRLENKDISLAQAMIPLGSCTMKLNATSEMQPVSWAEFAHIHPFAPAAQVQGYRAMIQQLEAWLADVTGYDAVSMQPNAGSQGEYAGLLAIKEYQRAQGQGHRDICLIPSSAHGTNPATAAMVGLKVVVVECDEQGNVDVDDLRAKAAQHADALSCLMITYPSTHGVFEARVREICDIVHQHGGQVYLDGANMNALVGLAGPGLFGADVSHLNLHKTFAIPHGGGGPGMGPIGVKAHLAPYLPSHPVVAREGAACDYAVSAAPYGSAGILCISWMYVAMLGSEGLTRATEVAILNANYIASQLAPHYPVLYTGQNGRVAHECIIDLRPLKAATGITEEDVAKRLMDFGFHAPTMSFPVPGTLMIEPTESESKMELDRFVEAMRLIREEIRAVELGQLDAAQTALKNAPHTMADLADADWNRAYSREQACFPTSATKAGKYWPSVNRIDNPYGDKNFVCSCPGLDSYR